MADQRTTLVNGEPQPVSSQARGPRLFWFLTPMILLLGLVVFLGWSYMKSEGYISSHKKSVDYGEPAPRVSLKPFVVNLMDAGEYPRYLKVQFDLELRPGSKIEEVEAQLAELRDAIILLLTSKRSQDLISVEGKDRLRDEILTRVNSRLRSAMANRIYFREFIIQ